MNSFIYAVQFILLLWNQLHTSISENVIVNVHRTVVREGFHREIQTTVTVGQHAVKVPDSGECGLLLIEHLPSGLYVDPFQLDSLAQFGGPQVLTASPVDIEAPEYLSAPLDLFVYSSVLFDTPTSSGSLTVTVSLPVHVRYHRPSPDPEVTDVAVTLYHPRVLLNCAIPGGVPLGLHVHPDKRYLVYPLGSNVIIEDLENPSSKQTILSKHTNYVSCIAIDPTGRCIATGQINYMGFKASIILWKFNCNNCEYVPVQLSDVHKVKVEMLAFSRDSQYLFSLGGRDCGSVIVWRVDKEEPLCGSPAQVESAGITNCLAASKSDPCQFVTAGNNTLRVWKLDAANRKITPTEVKLGGLKREVNCIELADDMGVPYILCGTSSGDILGIINSSTPQLQFLVPEKENLSLGVTALSIVSASCDGVQLLVGTGDGVVGLYDLKWTVDISHHIHTTFKHRSGLKPWKDCKLKKRYAVTSIAKRGSGHQFFVGTENSQIYKFNFSELSADLFKTSLPGPVNHIIFPYGSNELFITCGDEEIRVWWTKTGVELCRYTVPNMICNSVCISRDGFKIFTAWGDGKVRMIGLEREKDGTNKMFDKADVLDAHNKGVTAIAINSAGSRLVTGGGEGQVRVWQLVEDSYTGKLRADLKANMKEHKGKVTSIQISPKDDSCVSASTDGSTIIWDLMTNTRKQIMLANTLFKCVCFGEKALHILTSGTDHKIGYWDVQDGALQRELEGSKTGAINTMDISADCSTFITGGEDRLLKLWKYNEGSVTHVGMGHSNQITTACICPCQKMIISGGEDGAIHIWKYPTHGHGFGQM